MRGMRRGRGRSSAWEGGRGVAERAPGDGRKAMGRGKDGVGSGTAGTGAWKEWEGGDTIDRREALLYRRTGGEKDDFHNMQLAPRYARVLLSLLPHFDKPTAFSRSSTALVSFLTPSPSISLEAHTSPQPSSPPASLLEEQRTAARNDSPRACSRACSPACACGRRCRVGGRTCRVRRRSRIKREDIGVRTSGAGGEGGGESGRNAGNGRRREAECRATGTKRRRRTGTTASRTWSLRRRRFLLRTSTTILRVLHHRGKKASGETVRRPASEARTSRGWGRASAPVSRCRKGGRRHACAGEGLLLASARGRSIPGGDCARSALARRWEREGRTWGKHRSRRIHLCELCRLCTPESCCTSLGRRGVSQRRESERRDALLRRLQPSQDWCRGTLCGTGGMVSRWGRGRSCVGVELGRGPASELWSHRISASVNTFPHS